MIADRQTHTDTRDGTGSHFVTQRPSDPGIQRPENPVVPVTLFYNELQMSKKYSKAKEFLIIIGKSKSSLHGLTSSDFSPTTDTWQWLLSCQHFKCTYCILGIFSKTGKTRVLHRVKMMTRWPGLERWPNWPIDPVTQWPSSVSHRHTDRHAHHNTPLHYRGRSSQCAHRSRALANVVENMAYALLIVIFSTASARTRFCHPQWPRCHADQWIRPFHFQNGFRISALRQPQP